MSRLADVATAAVAPTLWGTTYWVTTELLPQGYPITTSLIRALPAGLLLLLLVRVLPGRGWWGKVFVLGALNFAFFWIMLFVSAYRLPGGVAATVGAIQPLLVLLLSRWLLATSLGLVPILAALAGVVGVGLTVLTPHAALDHVGVAAGFAGTASMAAGTVLTRRWQPPVGPLAFTAWQLTAGGILLLPLALVLEPPLPALTAANVAGFAWLALVGGAITYMLWFRGIARLEPNAVSPLVLLSPVTATLIGWLALHQTLSPWQAFGMLLVLGSVWIGNVAAGQRRPRWNAVAASQPAASASATDMRP